MARRDEIETVDVEELVARAYRDHVVDRISATGLLAMRAPCLMGVSPTALIGSHLALGTEIDTSTAGANFAGRAAMMQAVGDDFIDLHGAVLRLPCFFADLCGPSADFVLWTRAELIRAREWGFDVEFGGTFERPAYRITTLRHDGPAPAGATAYRNGFALTSPGTPAEGEGPSCPLYPVRRHADAPTRPLYAIEPAPLLVLNGRAGSRPDVSPLAVARMRPVYRGKRKVVGHEPVWETPPATVALQRATHAAWRTALILLAGELQELERFRVVGPSVAAAPWAGENCAAAPAGRVLHAEESLTG